MTQDWLRWDAEHIWHPYTQMALVPNAHGVTRASGSYVYLSNGACLFDAISSWWVTLHGHAHPAVAEAIAEQARKLEQVIFAGFTHEPAAILSKKLAEITPAGLERVFYSDNGSTAVEAALKMCIQYWSHRAQKRKTFLQLDAAYHGDTFGAMSVSSRSVFTQAFEQHLFEVIKLPFPGPDEAAENHFLDELTKACRSDDIAGFIFEPLLLGAGGMLMWRAEVLEQAFKIAKEHGVLTIADEILTGFGRTGKMFACDHQRYSPDIMTLSKGLTGGFLPLGVTMVTDEIYAAFLSSDRRKTFFHGHSFTGNPLSCAAAVASIELFTTEPTWERIAAIANTHASLGPQLSAKHDLSFRQLGTVAALQPRQSKGYLSDRSIEIAQQALDKGVLLRPLGDVVYFLPPYSTTPEDLAMAYDVLDSIFAS